MFRVALLGQDDTAMAALCRDLSQSGFACSWVPDDQDDLPLSGQRPDIVILDYDSIYRIAELSRTLKDTGIDRIIALVRRDLLGRVDGQFNYVDDFVAEPFEPAELQLRIRRLLKKDQDVEGEETLKCGELLIDMAKCEVSVGGRPVVLTYKEYELLKFLVNNQGRVCTRDMLLDKVWGIDYFGGDRTVDVHIRRLRSKVEDPAHTFIETVRNIGYRFKAEG